MGIKANGIWREVVAHLKETKALGTLLSLVFFCSCRISRRTSPMRSL